MGTHDTPPFAFSLRIGSLVLPLLSFLSCAGSSATIGVTSPSDAEEDSSSTETVADHDATPDYRPDLAVEEPQEPREGDDADFEGELESESSGSVSTPELEAELLREEAAHQALAELALHQAAGEPNHLGIQMAISERASDLPWILALKNTSSRNLRLAALPSLLRFDVTSKDEQTTVRCGGTDLPKKLESDETLELQPGQMLYYPFDPRTLCNEDATLSEGSQVTVTYGFETQTKKLWRGGKLIDVEVPQTDPFVAVAEANGQDSEEELVGLKYLTSSSFVLGATYPMESVVVEPPNDPESTDSPGPLTLRVSNLGTRSQPENGEIVVTLSNVSQQSITLLLRRENFTFEVVGDWSSTTCEMDPDDRAPDPAGFSTLSPGESSTLVTRLAEACPPGTWRYPGRYSISAKFASQVSGREYGIDAFVGEVYSVRPAQLFVPGSKRRSTMRLSW